MRKAILPANPRRKRIVLVGLAVLLAAPVGCGRSSVETLSRQLSEGDSEARYEAAKGLEEFGAQATPAVAELAAALKAPETRLRYRAAKALSKIGPTAEAAVPALAEALQDEDAQVRYYAAKALSKIGSAAGAAVPALVRALKDSDTQVRVYAAKSLYECETKSRELIPDLLDAMNHDDHADVRYYAALTLGHVGSGARQVIAALQHAEQSSDTRLQEAARIALEHVRTHQPHTRG